MSNGRKKTLDQQQQRAIIAIVGVGCSRARAAKFVGCSVGAIDALARRDPAFGRRLDEAETQAELIHLKNINTAANEARHWRAAAWALEHLYPEDYALRRPRSMSAEQIRRALGEFAEIILDDIADESLRDKILARLDSLAQELATDPGGEKSDEPESLSDD
jgi:hypothetical protein